MAAVDQDKNKSLEVHAVILCVGDEELGVEISAIREITKMLDITVIHESTGFIQGVVNLRGQIVAVIDLAKQFGLPVVTRIPEKSRIVFVGFRSKTFGLIVDQVSDVVRFSLESAAATSGHGKTSVQENLRKGTGSINKKSIVLLDLEKFFLKFIA